MNLIDNATETFELVESCGQICLFTEKRINRESNRFGLFCYELREDDYAQGIPCSVEPYVTVNFCGTLLCRRPIVMTDQDSTGRLYRSLVRGHMTTPPEEALDGDNAAYYLWLDSVDEDFNRLGYEILAEEFVLLSEEEAKTLITNITEVKK